MIIFSERIYSTNAFALVVFLFAARSFILCLVIDLLPLGSR